jgi:hypothetical protein
MIRWRLAVPAVLVAAALAGCFTYFVPLPPPATADLRLPEKMPELRMGIPANVDRPKAQDSADDFLKAAQAILKQEPNAQASADKPPIAGHIPFAEEATYPAPMKTADVSLNPDETRRGRLFHLLQRSPAVGRRFHLNRWLSRTDPVMGLLLRGRK